MKAVVHYALEPCSVELREIAEPTPRAGEVLVRVRAVGVCGSDLHQYHNTQSWQVNVPVVLGHEFAGVIEAVGEGVQGWQVGDRVACETAAVICEQCAYCRTGRYNLCLAAARLRLRRQRRDDPLCARSCPYPAPPARHPVL
jgi:L-iditol 2-dehydrogenase